MGFIFTKYGTGTDAIKFDVDKFDYAYDSDTFPSDAAEDFDNILIEHGDIYYFFHPNDTEDSMGRVTDTTNDAYRLYGMFQDITLKDRKIHDMGLAVPGNRKFFFKPSYSTTSGGVTTEYELKEGDFIKDSKLYGTDAETTGLWRVEKITRQWWEPGTEIFRVAIVKNINLDGS